jgi:hypothetical protein
MKPLEESPLTLKSDLRQPTGPMEGRSILVWGVTSREYAARLSGIINIKRKFLELSTLYPISTLVSFSTALTQLFSST